MTVLINSEVSDAVDVTTCDADRICLTSYGFSLLWPRRLQQRSISLRWRDPRPGPWDHDDWAWGVADEMLADRAEKCSDETAMAA